jgi:hypothetical protein
MWDCHINSINYDFICYISIKLRLKTPNILLKIYLDFNLEVNNIEYVRCPRFLCSDNLSVVSKVCSTDPLGSATSSQEIRVYISVVASLKFNKFLIRGISYVKNNRRNS